MNIEPFIAHRENMIRYAYKILRHRESAEDAVQDAFERLLRHQPKEALVNERAFMYRVVYGICLDKIDYHNRRPREAYLAPWHPDDNDDLDSQMHAEVLHEKLYLMVGMLAEKQREAFWCEFDGLRYAEIAEQIGVTHSAVKSVLWRARKTLQMICEKNGLRNEIL